MIGWLRRRLQVSLDARAGALLEDWLKLGREVPILPGDGPGGIVELRERTRRLLG